MRLKKTSWPNLSSPALQVELFPSPVLSDMLEFCTILVSWKVQLLALLEKVRECNLLTSALLKNVDTTHLSVITDRKEIKLQMTIISTKCQFYAVTVAGQNKNILRWIEFSAHSHKNSVWPDQQVFLSYLRNQEKSLSASQWTLCATDGDKRTTVPDGHISSIYSPALTPSRNKLGHVEPGHNEDKEEEASEAHWLKIARIQQLSWMWRQRLPEAWRGNLVTVKVSLGVRWPQASTLTIWIYRFVFAPKLANQQQINETWLVPHEKL